MPSLKKKTTRQNKTTKILNIINTKIDMVQETLNKMVNKDEDIESGEFTTTTVTTPTSETIGSYQSDMNSGEEAGMASQEQAVMADQGPISSLTDNASYGASVAPEGQVEGTDNTSNEASGESNVSSDENLSPEALSTVANKESETATRSPVTPLAEGASEATTVEAASEATTVEGENPTKRMEAEKRWHEDKLKNDPNYKNLWENTDAQHPDLDPNLDPDFNSDYGKENKTGGKKRTHKRKNRRNMKSRRRQSRR